MLFKDKKAGGEISFDTKTGKLQLKKILNNNQNKEKSIEEYKEIENSDSYIKEFKIYKEFTILINLAQNLIIKDLSIFLRHNNITDMDMSAYSQYIQNKIALIASIYNNQFQSSKNSFINTLTVVNLLGNLRPIVRQNIKDFFNNVYNTHKNLNDKRIEYIKRIKEKTDDSGQLLAELYSLMYKDLNECLDRDTQDLYLLVNEIDSVLIGLFHDLIVEYIGSKK